MKIIILLVIGAILVLALIIGGCAYSRFGYESAPYTIVERDGRFEIREYPELTLVSTPMDGSNPNDGGSFMRLFRYISKDNEEQAKIPMTTPVFTVPGEEEETSRMSFVVPAAVAEAGAPAPASDQVTVETLPGGRFAVYRFSGSWDPARARAAEEKLRAWMAAKEASPIGESLKANYDPPFMPPFFRRNEVLLRVRG